jgi:hypothetical protein
MAGLALLLVVGEARAEAPCAEFDGYRACYEAPTDRYPHGVLGDDLEWGVLRLSRPTGSDLVLTLPEDRVFEDIAPRLADLDGVPPAEIVTVESTQTGGAALSIWQVDRGHLAPYARTADIGTRFRWLAPVGIADLTGDGGLDIAYVETPHLAGILRVWTFAAGGLTEVAAAAGLSNHRIGDAMISGGIRDCGDGPEMITADLDWARLVSTRVEAGALVHRDLGPLDGAQDFEDALACRR